MFLRFCLPSLLLLITSTLLAQEASPKPLKALQESYDVVIAGAGTGGFGAAMQAARMGATVLLLEETDYIGGQMNAAAVTSMDEGPIIVRERGLYHEFVDAVNAHYNKLGMSAETAYGFRHICMEPHVGQQILYDMLAEARTHTKALDITLQAQVTEVLKEGNAVTGVKITSGKKTRTIQSKILMDATEWGDVIPLTGARYRVGNCFNDNVDMKRRIQDLTWTAVIKEYPQGVPDELVIHEAPPGYTPAVHQGFVRTLAAGDDILSKEAPWSFERFIRYRGMPNSEQPNKVGVITRTHMNFNNDHPTTIGDVEDLTSRQKTLRSAMLKTLHLLYYVQHTIGKTDWSVANDEGYDTPYNRAQMDAWIADQPELAPYRDILYHFSIMAYARESRRIVGLHTLRAREIERKPRQPTEFINTIALGDYAVDLHGSKKPELLELDLDPVEDIPQGSFGSHGTGPFAIPFECFIPETVDGFIPAEKNISQSRLANGATRLQPSTMLMGQAAGAIAALAIQNQVQPRQLDPILVQDTLLKTGDTLQITPLKDIAKTSWEWQPAQMVTVRGLMSLKEGKFLPDQPLTPEAAAQIFKCAFDQAVKFPTPVTPTVFAEKLKKALAEHQVTLTGLDNLAKTSQAMTRREAADLMAQGLVKLAQARQTQTPQTFAWPAPRTPTPIDLAEISPQLAADLRVLIDHKLISSFDYWIAHATENSTCSGKNVGILLKNTARSLQPQRPADEAVMTCVEEGILGTPGYWQKSAVEGSTCSGTNVQTVIRRIAQIMLTKKPLKAAAPSA
ncbi:FAD dependent oxidoreductase [Prosthecobacter debontii]|uniref:FAD dependent oxidoreductase n=1 Tax=Prosthecobacter debontii TaxID=48467 RepID=A0A1T4YLN8_9BACT|nr:FAD-dependent oxidoreductase [Prosthecobacter debontii]SKB02185.1 FAD dependent oxidoreductase [Prosthecobacter debontii]